jgi:hypothetical protein
LKTGAASQGIQLDPLGVNGDHGDGTIRVEAPVVVDGQPQNGTDLLSIMASTLFGTFFRQLLGTRLV